MELKNSSEKSCFVIKPNTKKTFFIAILKPVAIYTQNIKIKDSSKYHTINEACNIWQVSYP